MRCDCCSPFKNPVRIISQYFQTAWKKNAESNSFYHREIIEALVKHDTERAVEMLQKDILNVKEQIQENYSL